LVAVRGSRMAANYKLPPKFDEKNSYECWKNEMAMWLLVTDLEKPKQALAVALSLTGKARETALEVPAADLNKDTGMASLLTALDAVFMKEAKDSAYEAYSNFDSFRRSGISISDYVFEFEHRYNKCRKHNMTLPDAVLAFKLLDNAGLNVKERQLALTATSDLTFASMKGSLRRIFGEGTGQNAGSESIQVKQESAYYTQSRRSTNEKYNSKSQSSSTPVRGTNPLNKYGKRTKCAICQSVFHWVKDCPEKTEGAKMAEHVTEPEDVCNVTLLTKEVPSDFEIFMTESMGSAVLDTACTKTVCGERWLSQYVGSLNEENKKAVESLKSSRRFKFGDGNIVHSFETVTIPATIGRTACKIETEVVKVDIPLLLSKDSLKRAGTVLDLQNDKAVMFNEPVTLEFTSSGHYCVNILDKENKSEERSAEEEILVVTEDMNVDEQRKMLLKLHRQFGHASSERIKKLLKSAGTDNSETFDLLQEIVDSCDTCRKFKRPSPKPAVGFPLATRYNETVAVDLHELDRNVWYLHIIDEFTRFSAGCIMRTKQSSEFVQKFIQIWISVHGAPQKLYSDNGGEFCNAEVRDMAENFNIEVKTTPAYSPWSNGLLERHNQTLTEILLKVKDENKIDWETALNWALMAKNALHSVHGYSPYQLVFGQNPNLPGVLTDQPPALEGTTMSDVVGKHIAVLHSTRKAFMESESSERIRRALRKQVRPAGDRYVMGEKVYYKRPDGQEWKGPGTVIGQDGVVVFVRHGGSYVRVHQCRLQSLKNVEFECDQRSRKNKLVEKEQVIQQCSTSSSDAVLAEEQWFGFEDDFETTDRLKNTETKIKPGEVLQFRDLASGNLYVAKVLSRAGKVSGKYKNWYNLEYREPDEMIGTTASVDLNSVEILGRVNEAEAGVQQDDHVSETESSINEGEEENIMVCEDASFQTAKCDELDSWKRNEVYEEMHDSGQKCISTRWICTYKETPNGVIPKARLVARGFEEMDNRDIPKDSPTCSTESLRMILALFAQNKWKAHSMDIKTAFLQGSKLSRDIYLRPPKEVGKKGVVWHLKKCVYGLTDASLYWYKKVCDVLKSCGARISSVDPAVFFWCNEKSECEGVLASHVDDFIWSGSVEFEQSVIPHIRSAFNVGREEKDAFSYVGIELTSVDGIISLQQQDYVDNLKPITVDRERRNQRDSLLLEQEFDLFRSKVGQILWVARQSRPDVMFDACNLASSIKKATVQSLIDTNKVVRKLKAEKLRLQFQYLGEKDLEIVVFSDSSLGNLPDGGTQGGHLILLVGENGRFSPISWHSKRVRRVVRSTLAGETLAMADGIDTAIFLATLYAELTTGCPQPTVLPIVCVTDCHSLFDAVKSTKFVTDKRLRLEISSIKELIQCKQVGQILWSRTKEQLADCLTKKGASAFLLLKTLSDGVWQLNGQ